MKNVSLKLPGTVDERLRARARQTGRSLGAVVREAVAQYLSDTPAGRRQSVASAAADLAGCASGPTDLSVNRRHLDGYGR